MIDGPGYGWYHPKQGLVFHSKDDYRYNIGREGGVMISNGVITPLTGGPPFNLNKVRQGKTDWDKNLGWHFEGMTKRMTPDPHKNVDVRNLNMNTIADALMGANYADSWIHEEFRAMGIKPFGHMPVEGMVIPIRGDKNHMYEIKVGSTAWKMLQAGYGIKDIVNQIKPTERYFSAWREFRAPHQERLSQERAQAARAAQEAAAERAAGRRAEAREQEILAMNAKLQQWALKKWKSYAKKRGYSSSAIGNFQRSGQWWNMFASNRVFKQDLENYLKKLGFTWADLRPPNVNFEGGRGTLHGQGIRAN